MSRATDLYDVVRLTRPIVLNSARVVEGALRDTGVTVGMRAVLELLTDAGPLTVPRVARRLDIARQGVQRVIDDLERSALVAAQANPDHKRSPLYDLTESGRRTFDDLHALEIESLTGMASELTPNEISAAHRVLSVVDARLREGVRNAREAPAR